MKPAEFIKKIAPAAQRINHLYGILPSVVLAQSALESGWGKVSLVDKHSGKESFNLFGIKGKGTAGSVKSNTKEFVSGRMITVEAEFRAYHNWDESIEDHSSFLQGPRYKAVKEATNYQDAAFFLQKAGYATDPQYAKKLIRIIQQYGMDQYDSD